MSVSRYLKHFDVDDLLQAMMLLGFGDDGVAAVGLSAFCSLHSFTCR